ncbi:hypothetical protein [Acinetobacter sp. ANC 4641]|uniref:hypothetical protein n=1 Tax=Acinetobacter sp. ANC 4641 TaxID=2529847 RepID=UPI001040D666|nr:hypothetical protein [Acinetobacter sp. ANC 4641]TCB09609.1 hypothetical protein E0H78_10795 [Acinetobacter sp. ANC 4641]
MAVDEKIQQKIDFYFNVLDRYDHYIELADTKAGNHLTLLGTLLVAVTAVFSWGVIIPETGKHFVLGCNLQTGLIFLFLFFLVSCWYWYCICNSVLKPNTKPVKDDATAQQTNRATSTIFFGDVEEIKLDEFEKIVLDEMDEGKLLKDLVGQVHVVAHITKVKFENYSKINRAVLASVLVSILILVISGVLKLG